MKVRRIMRPEELQKFVKGETLENKTDFSKIALTASFGFCFFNTEDVPVEEHVTYLPGLRAEDFVVTFETTAQLTVSWGQYKEGAGKTPEYCTTQYSNVNFQIIGVEPITKYGTFMSRKVEEERAARMAAYRAERAVRKYRT